MKVVLESTVRAWSKPGTYSCQETFPAGWNLTTAACSDGSSSFSVDIVSGIVVDLGTIECVFENEFVGTISDTDEMESLMTLIRLPNTSI